VGADPERVMQQLRDKLRLHSAAVQVRVFACGQRELRGGGGGLPRVRGGDGQTGWVRCSTPPPLVEKCRI
jgi:hypothetical protein